MAKRFTDTSKWKRPWFRALSPHAKVLWQYLCDECDHAGIFLADFDLITFQVGFRVDEGKLCDLLGDKIVKIDRDKYFIPSFFEFQYADAKDGFKAKQSALKTLRSWNLLDESDSLKDLSNSYLSVTGQSKDCPSIGIGIGIGKSNTGESEGKSRFDEFYARYPRKEKKKEARKRYGTLIKSGTSSEQIMKGLVNYLADLKRKKTKPEFYKLPTTFLNELPDNWINQETETIQIQSAINFSDMAREIWAWLQEPSARLSHATQKLLDQLPPTDFNQYHRDDFRPGGIVPGLLKEASERAAS